MVLRKTDGCARLQSTLNIFHTLKNENWNMVNSPSGPQNALKKFLIFEFRFSRYSFHLPIKFNHIVWNVVLFIFANDTHLNSDVN